MKEGEHYITTKVAVSMYCTERRGILVKQRVSVVILIAILFAVVVTEYIIPPAAAAVTGIAAAALVIDL